MTQGPFLSSHVDFAMEYSVDDRDTCTFPSRSPGTLQVRYCTKLKFRDLVPKKRRREGRKAQSLVRDID
jgi:hypothetical protein